MTPWLSDPDVTLYHGDVLAVLRELPAESVDCCVTSPPYWGLRDYGTGAWEGGDEGCDHRKQEARAPHERKSSTLEGGVDTIRVQEEANVYRDTCGKCGATRIDQQLGLEPTPEEYVTRIVEVFREVRRVLAPHGTVWLNLGDSYAASNNTGGTASIQGTRKRIGAMNSHLRPLPDGLKPKDLVGIPWRVAFALQAEGWYLRSDIIWAKPNPMPESVTDRPTKAHEYVFLLSKQPRYFFDQEAVREVAEYGFSPASGSTFGRVRLADHRDERDTPIGTVTRGSDLLRRVPQSETLDGSDGEAPRGPDGRRKTSVQGGDGSIQHRDGERWPNGGRNIRSVWEIATQPYPEAHFATFPEELARRCIAAGCPEQVCRVCGKARERVVEVSRPDLSQFEHRQSAKSSVGGTQRADDGAAVLRRDGEQAAGRLSGQEWNRLTQRKETGFTDCNHADYRPGITLDPFMGSGTVAHVARKLGRHAVGIDLNESYLELAARRLQQQSLFATEVGA